MAEDARGFVNEASEVAVGRREAEQARYRNVWDDVVEDEAVEEDFEERVGGCRILCLGLKARSGVVGG